MTDIRVAGMDLEYALGDVPGPRRTTACKLLARKRPRLLPIWDTVVARILGTRDDHLVPVRAALRPRQQPMTQFIARQCPVGPARRPPIATRACIEVVRTGLWPVLIRAAATG
ncbi:DUF6308 family protein [Nocardia africana]